MKYDLLPHQPPIVDYIVKEQHPALFLEMRLGKTVTMLEGWQRRGLSTKVLVVAPKSTLRGWWEHARMWGFRSNVVESKDLLDHHFQGWTFTTYAAVKLNPSVRQRRFRGVILDESTEIRNPKSDVSKVIANGFRLTDHRAILSGLPAPEDPSEYFQQFLFLHGDFQGYDNFYKWRAARFRPAGFGWKPKDGDAIKQEVAKRAYELSREDAGLEPAKYRQILYVSPTEAQRAAEERIRREWHDAGGSYTKWRVVIQSWLARIAGGFDGKRQVSTAKEREIVRLLENELSGHQVVVYFKYNQELAAVWKRLKKLGVSATWITGELNGKERRRREVSFQQGKRRVMLAQIKVTQYGLDFSPASVVVNYSFVYSLLDHRQSHDRIVNVAKGAGDLLYIALVTEGTIDEDVVPALDMKDMSARYFMGRVMANYRERNTLGAGSNQRTWNIREKDLD